ncbi:MAG: GTP 3',8-cyclase MoaA [Cyclobacteriaceae bacterium]|nr:GTP 3',8-cyclase MoaA [Cyclobacteriaceae bacterium]
MIQDTFGRVHDYLRISLTDVCNFRCFYCMPEEEYDFTPSSRLMQADEIRSLAGIFVDLGVKKIRLTGGEPLVRKDAGKIILSLSELPVLLTLTTNGTRLHHFVPVLQQAGIRSVNISLDTLNAKKFVDITRRDQFMEVMDNVDLLIRNNFHVKINVVVTRGLNELEIKDFVEWTRNVPVHIRFIEFMPFNGNRWSSDQVFTWQEILDLISQHYQFDRLDDELHATAKKYQIPGHQGTFAVISTMSAPFCGTCNRMRLTADGKMKNCLFSKNEMDLLTALRKGDDIVPLVRECVGRKEAALGGQLTPQYQKLQPDFIRNRSMITIGG